MKGKKRTAQDKRNRNDALGQLSNFALATSLALTGTGLLDFLTDEPKFTKVEATLFFTLGLGLLWVSCFINYGKEDPDDTEDE